MKTGHTGGNFSH